MTHKTKNPKRRPGKTWVALNYGELLAVADHCLKLHASAQAASVWFTDKSHINKSWLRRTKMLRRAELFTKLAAQLIKSGRTHE